MRVAVLGGTGKTGRAVCAGLLERGAEPVPLGRAAWGSVGGLPAALAGCDAAYVVAPNLHPDEPAYVGAALDAMRTAGVGRVGYHSVASPYAPAMPHHLGKARAEDLVRRSGLAWTVLQPGAYLQNLDLTRDLRIAYRADAPFGFADLDDVGRAAAVVLTGDGHDGATYELASVRTTVADLAAGAGVAVEVVTPEEWAVTDGAALDPRERAWLMAMFASYDLHGLPVGTRVLAGLLDDAPVPVARLGLEPHPEGGWYRQTWAAAETVTLPDGRVRPTATLIWFWLPAGEASAWHHVASEEIWLAARGTVVLETGGDGAAPAAPTRHLVGIGTDADGQVVVPARTWQRTVPGGADALVSCLVSPGFDFADFDLA